MLSKVIAQANIDHAEKWFERADKIVIVTHVSPDGDAIGCESLLGEVADSVLHTGSNNEVFRLILLHNQPHALNVVLRVAPVTQRIHVAQFP